MKKLAVMLLVLFLLLPALPAQASMQISAGRLDYRGDWIELEDGVIIFWQDLEIKSRRGEIDRGDSIAYLYDDIEMVMERGDITSLKMTIYLDDEDILFEDDVVLNFKEDRADREEREDIEDSEEMEEREDGEELVEGEESEEREDGREAIRLTAPRLMYFAARDSFEMDSGLTIYQGGRTISSDEGDYSEEDEIFNLRRNVVIVEENGDRITSDQARIMMGEGQVFTAEGNVTIELNL